MARGDEGLAASWFRTYAIFGALLLAGLILRLLALRSTWGQPDGDSAISMLMAIRASQGHFSLLYWGQNYGGAGLAWIEAPLILIFGAKLWLFYAIDAVLVLIGALLLRAIGARFLSRTAADIAAGVFSFFPALWLFWGSRDYVFYVPAIVFALATGLSVIRWFESRDERWLWASGLCAGLSVWFFPLVFPLLAPPMLLLAWSLRKERRPMLKVVASGFVGVAPWLAYFVVHGRNALHRQAVTTSQGKALARTVTQVLPTTLVGGEKRFGVTWSVSTASSGHLALLGVGVYVAILAHTVIAASRREITLAACGASVVIWPVVLVLGHVPIGTDTYRYGVIVVAPLLLLAVDALSRVRLAPLLALVALLSVTHTVAVDTSNFASAPSCYRPLVDTNEFLVSRHRTAIWASYWLSGPLELCSNNDVIASSVAPLRDHLAEVRAASAARSTYVVFPDRGLDRELVTWTRQHHVRAVRSVPDYYAVWEFESPVTPAQMGLHSNF